MENIDSKKIILSITSLVYGLLVLVFAGMTYFSISITGIPEGGTEYDRATILPLTIFNWINFASSFVFFYLYYYSRLPNGSSSSKRLIIAIFLHIIFCAITLYGIEFYYKDYLGLNYGLGG